MPADFGASSYASRLTPRTEKGGGLGLPEHAEEEEITASKILKLADLIRTSKKCVVLTGAGISTSAGVSDFRGPNGVWTAEKVEMCLEIVLKVVRCVCSKLLEDTR